MERLYNNKSNIIKCPWYRGIYNCSGVAPPWQGYVNLGPDTVVTVAIAAAAIVALEVEVEVTVGSKAVGKYDG